MHRVGAEHPRGAREALGHKESEVLKEGGHGRVQEHAGDERVKRIAEGPQHTCYNTFHGMSHQPNKAGTIIVPIL